MGNEESAEHDPGLSGMEVMQAVVMNALANLMEQEALPTDKSVTSSAARLAVLIIGEYVKTDTDISKAIGDVVEGLRNKDDEIVQSLGVVNRQMIWGALSNLRKQKDTFNASHEKTRIQINAEQAAAEKDRT